jgi:hypothetical protein
MRKLRQSSSVRSKRFSPLSLIAVAVTLVMILGAGIYFIVLPKMLTHAAAANPNANCTLIVPQDPLSPRGLATPYQLVATNPNDGPCNEANAAQSAFVQSVIYDRATGKFSVYNPLVIDKGTRPAANPTPPTLPAGAVVGIWFGFNATNLQLKARDRHTLAQANCVNGLGNSLFTQFAYCNAPAFFAAANQGIVAGRVRIPQQTIAKDGLPCPTVRDFSVIDQDQSDNVQTQYLATANGQLAQFSAANAAKLPNATTVANPSDNALLTAFINPTLGCQSWEAPNLADNNAMVGALALDELQASKIQKAPIALVPLNDPMTVIGDNNSLAKTDLYRRGVDQIIATNNSQASGKTYCLNYLKTGLPRLELDKPFTMTAASPDPATANSLFTFLAQRFQGSWDNLNCVKLTTIPNPVTVQIDTNGIAISAAFTNTGAGAPTTGATPTAVPPTTSATPTAVPPTTSATPTAVPPTTGATPTAVPTSNSTAPTPVPTTTGSPTGTGSGNGQPLNCSVNGQLINGCTGTTTINNVQCTFTVEYNTVTINCPTK